MWRHVVGLMIVGLMAVGSELRGEIRPVAVVGAAAPNTTAGERFYNLRNMQFNNRGEVAFFGQLMNGAREPIYFRAGDDPMYDLTPDVGVWVIGNGETRLAARQGMAAPDSPSGTRLWLIDPTDSDDGRYDFRLSNAGLLLEAHIDGGNDSPAIWMMPRQGETTRILAAGDPDAGSGLAFHDMKLSYLSDSGYALFQSGLRQPGDPNYETAGYGQWIYSAASGLTALARSRSPAVGLPPPTAFDSMFFSHGTLNEQGVAVFPSDFAPSPEEVSLTSWSSSDSNGIWRGMSENQLSLVAVSTDVDGTGAPLFPFGAPRTNERGDIAVVTRNGNGAVLFRDGGKQIYARETMAPGTVDKYFSGVEQFELAETGKVALMARMRGDDFTPYGRGLWQDDGSGLVPVILPEQIPPLADGSVFVGVDSGTLSMNASGQIAVVALLRDVAGEFNRGLFAQDRQGNLVTIVAPGQTVEVAPGDERIIVAVTEAQINDLGQVAFYAHFQDGETGIFISDAVAVPEPTAWLTLALGAVVVGAIARRRRVSGGLRTAGSPVRSRR